MPKKEEGALSVRIYRWSKPQESQELLGKHPAITHQGRHCRRGPEGVSKDPPNTHPEREREREGKERGREISFKLLKAPGSMESAHSITSHQPCKNFPALFPYLPFSWILSLVGAKQWVRGGSEWREKPKDHHTTSANVGSLPCPELGSSNERRSLLLNAYWSTVRYFRLDPLILESRLRLWIKMTQ